MKNVMMYNIIRMIMSSYVLHIYTSLSTIVLNSRDWKEIILLPEKLHFKNQALPAGMHW